LNVPGLIIGPEADCYDWQFSYFSQYVQANAEIVWPLYLMSFWICLFIWWFIFFTV
jgi:hypothetical protein